MKLGLSVNLHNMTALHRKGRWRPQLLFTHQSQGAVFSADTGAFQDVAGTLPVTTPGQSVACLHDQSGLGLHATQSAPNSRPTFGRHPASGLRNRLPNTRMDGAATGVLGAGGALPAAWGISNIPNSAVEVLSIAPKNGRPNTRIRLSGTPTGNMQINFTPPASVSSATGQTWSGSAWVQMVGGSTANITGASIINTHFSTTGFLGGTNGGNFLDSLADDLRRAATGVLSGAGITNTRILLQLSLSGGAIDIVLDISAPQLEQASEPSAVQITAANGFDVTEAGQDDVQYLGFDGVDDRLAFATPFGGQTSYMLAAAHDIAFLPAAPNEGIIFGGTGRFTKTVSSGLRWRNQAVDNQADFSTQSVQGRQVDIVQIDGPAAPQAWRSGQTATISTLAGSLSPLTGLSHIFNAGSAYSSGRFYAGALIPRALSGPERMTLQAWLATKAALSI